MPCLIALLVLSVLGIFSASHRKLAQEAFDCVFRRITLKPCDTGFDVKIKATVLGFVLKRSPNAAAWLSKHFEWLAWALILGLTASSMYSLYGLYNFWAWGHCDGPVSSSFCAFDPTGENTKTSSGAPGVCVSPDSGGGVLSLNRFDDSLYSWQSAEQRPEMLIIGCYGCPYTRESYPLLKDVAQKQQASYEFVFFPVHASVDYLLDYDACMERDWPELREQFVDWLFETPLSDVENEEQVRGALVGLGIDATLMDQCRQDESLQRLVRRRNSNLMGTGLWGTPTVFIGETGVVGPKPERVYKRLLSSWF